MKKLIIITLALIAAQFLKAQINMNSLGYVGIGTNAQSQYFTIAPGVQVLNGYYNGIKIDPSGGVNYGLCIHPSSNNTGAVGSSNCAFSQIWSYSGSITLSDKRQKENITNINGALCIVKNLQGVRYDLKQEFAYSSIAIMDAKEKELQEKLCKNKIGFIAQDVFKVLPEVVYYDDSTNIYGISYEKLTPILVEAIKEQQAILESLQAEMKELKNNTINSNNFKSASISTGTSNSQVNTNTLYQNSPNPFSQITTIEYLLSDNVRQALICIYDMNGTQLKSIPLHHTGSGNISINGSELKSGMYMYSLIADGQLIDTKRMVLTD